MKKNPLQENGFDCGLFACMYIKCISCDEEFSFDQSFVNKVRVFLRELFMQCDEAKVLKFDEDLWKTQMSSKETSLDETREETLNVTVNYSTELKDACDESTKAGAEGIYDQNKKCCFSIWYNIGLISIAFGFEKNPIPEGSVEINKESVAILDQSKG